ncbi:MAG: sugar nucleotide-binding protein [Candidatus Omnitrophota bacterium]
MNKKILILGKGFIGKRLSSGLDCIISDKKIYSFADAEGEIKKYNPQIIINCIGRTGRNMDECKLDIDKSLFANSFIPVILAEVALRNKIKLIHISSGCIFNYNYAKDKPITEKKIPDFFDLFYSRSKIYSERALEASSNRFNYLILRIRIPLDNRPHAKNLLDKLIQYKKVLSSPNSVTYLPDFIKALKHLINIDAKGIFNVVNKGGLVYADLLKEYKRYMPDFEYKVIKPEELGLVRAKLILSTKKLEEAGFKVRPVKDILAECVRSYLRYT